MKVKELMAWLQAMDPELRVVVDGYEGGVRDARYAELEVIALNVNDEWYYGDHEVVATDDGEQYDGHVRAHAVHIA